MPNPNVRRRWVLEVDGDGKHIYDTERAAREMQECLREMYPNLLTDCYEQPAPFSEDMP